MKNPEAERLKKTPGNIGWKKWGPYLSERQWGTVREDYSDNGDAWRFMSYEQAMSRVYRWGEDGIAGFSDTKQRLCFGLTVWNGKDPILKERLFGLTNDEGNHGEDVKELYYYLDSTPTHSYMKMLYKYPQNEFPYQKLRDENAKRNREQPEYELVDTGIFDKNEYFDIFTEYAKVSEEDTLIKITVHNRADKAAELHLLPTLWCRNTWNWKYKNWDYQPNLFAREGKHIMAEHKKVGDRRLYYQGQPELLFTQNENNRRKLFGQANKTVYCKDGINDYVIGKDKWSVNPQLNGTKASMYYHETIEAGGKREFRFRLTDQEQVEPFSFFDQQFDQRKEEADLFYDERLTSISDPELKEIRRQAYAGMMWSKQYYYYNMKQWFEGDPGHSKPSEVRKNGRNRRWQHIYNSNLLSMPDKWEYPWYAAWDLAFHCVPLANIDSVFAKRQLTLMLREYYMHPNGQIPAYEWNFSDVNPPVHAWGAWKVYCIDKEQNNGEGDTDFLAAIFHKLLMNFTWWVNQKDTDNNNLFEGGFLGLDNIGVFDRSDGLPDGSKLEQADGTGWMAMYSLNMMRIALELSLKMPYYQESASKFFEHFLAIAGSLTNIGQKGINLWDDEDQFYYDILHTPGQGSHLLKVRSIVGIIPLFAVEVLTPELLFKLPDFTRRLEWFLRNKPELSQLISRWDDEGKSQNKMLSLVRVHRMKCVLRRMLDETEFLSDYGVRALSKYHLEQPYQFNLGGNNLEVKYLPGESDSGMFGGNSNWRGPIWFPINYLIIESLINFYDYYGESEKLEFPTGSGNLLNLKEVALELAKRLIKIFRKDETGRRPAFGSHKKFRDDPHFRDHILFYEYFHGDDGTGLGASHQTGWTGLIAELIDRCE